MVPLLSLTVAIKDYYEIIHQLINVEGLSNIRNYTDLGPVFVYFLLSIKEFFLNIIGFQWIHTIWTYPIIIPDIASAMVSEISVLDGYFHTAFTLLDAPASSINSFPIICFHKFMTGLSNSLFLCLPTSVAHIITLRRFLIQGLEAGYISGLGVVSGNFFFLAAVLFGWRFFLIPWLSMDILRYLFGFILLVKYMWESSTEKQITPHGTPWVKQKIFLLSFFLSLTEQTSIFPFISNISMDSQSSLFESYSASTLTDFVFIHSFYLGGILIGSLSILNFCCWFWENPAFQIYMWTLTNFKVKTGAFYKYLNFGLLYLTMLAAITSIPYFGLDYTLTSPLGFVFEDRIVEESAFRAVFNEFSFLNMSPSDRNTRRNRGRHPRRSRWNRRTRKYRSFQSNLYEKERYDWMTIEDLNFGFDRQWSHRKMRNHRARYRLFPAKLTRSLKDQARKAFTKRHAFFETTENYFYHPSFHEYSKKTSVGVFTAGPGGESKSSSKTLRNPTLGFSNPILTTIIGSHKTPFHPKTRIEESSALRKFARKVTTKISLGQSALESNVKGILADKTRLSTQCAATCLTEPISSLRWKQVFSKIGQKNAFFKDSQSSSLKRNQLRSFYQKMVLNKQDNFTKVQQRLALSKKDLLMLRYRSFFNPQLSTQETTGATKIEQNLWKVKSILYPIKYYLQKEEAFTRKLQYYGVKNFRRFSQDYNPPIFRVLMQRYFYHYKPTKRFHRTLKGATMRRYLRKSSRKARVLQDTNSGLMKPALAQGANKGFMEPLPAASLQLAEVALSKSGEESDSLLGQARQTLTPANHFYSMKGKRASRYRYQIYRDVLQHWYYSPVNRLFPKIEIDSFIRRQPQTHFLNASEERILHLRRFLLSEHYDTLRWYTLMEQYKQMQTKIGSTKSLSSRTYSQQFFGTFKKIRHLFAITPSLQDQPILSFDQPLYNEYQNTSQKSLVNSSIIHEELLNDITGFTPSALQNRIKETDIITKSSFILKEYLKQVTSIRQKQIQSYLQEKKYWELMNFLRKGQKSDFNFQKKTSVVSLVDTLDGPYEASNTVLRNIQRSSLVSLLRKWKKSLGNQKLYKKALKNQFKRWRRTKKSARKKMQKYQNRKRDFIADSNMPDSSSNRAIIPSGLQKAYQDAMQIHQIPLNAARATFLPSGLSGQKLSIGALHSKITRKMNSEMEIVGKVFTARDPFAPRAKGQKQKALSVFSKYLKTTRTLKLTKIKALLQDQLRITVGSVKKLGQRVITVKKTRSWWNKKSTDTWRPNRRRLDLDGLRITVKHAEKDRASFLKPRNRVPPLEGHSREPYTRNLQNRYTLKKEQALNSDTLQIEKSWHSLSRFNLLSNANKGPNDYFQSEPVRLKQKENDSGSALLDTQKGRNWIENVGKNRLSNGTESLKILQRQFKRKRVSRRRGRKLVAAGYSRRPNLSALIKRTNQPHREGPYGSMGNYSIDQNFVFSAARATQRGQKTALVGKNVLSPLLSQKSPYYRKRKHREWDRKVKPDNGIKTNKYRKRRMTFYGKLRSAQKELIRVRWKFQVQKWWWLFMPSLRNTVESNWVSPQGSGVTIKGSEETLLFKKTHDVSKKLSVPFSQNDQVKTYALARGAKRDPFAPRAKGQIRNTDKKVTTLLSNNELSSLEKKSLQIGDRDFKPFGLPEALRIRRELEESSKIRELESAASKSAVRNAAGQTLQQSSHREGPYGSNEPVIELLRPLRIPESKDPAFLSNLTRNAFKTNLVDNPLPLAGNTFSSDFPRSAKLQITNAVPFYAGWDESLRKFVITNILYSLRDATYEMKNIQTYSSNEYDKPLGHNGNVVFTEAPLRGQNGATTVYWQTPFSTYETDQFFTLGVDGFSPLQWSRFHFSQSIVKNWSVLRTTPKALSPILVKDLNIFKAFQYRLQGAGGESESFSGTHRNPSETYRLSFLKNPSFGKVQTSAMHRDSSRARRRQKRYKRVRRHPRAPIWYPSGSLISDVLPTQYIYAFDSTARRPRDRYMQRRWRKRTQLLSNPTFKQITGSRRDTLSPGGKTTDFTLRRRPNGRRKYHQRGGKLRSLLTVAYPKRRKFIGSTTNELRWRPERSAARDPLGQKDSNYTIKLEEVRKRRGMALRRRKLRQVFPVIRRFKTLNGGFVWPGTYLLLEQRNEPKMHITPNDIQKASLERKSLNRSRRKKQRRKIKRKTRAIAQWNIQPKKYLLQKHNQKVIKKKLQKAYRTHNLAQKLEQLTARVP